MRVTVIDQRLVDFIKALGEVLPALLGVVRRGQLLHVWDVREEYSIGEAFIVENCV